MVEKILYLVSPPPRILKDCGVILNQKLNLYIILFLILVLLVFGEKVNLELKIAKKIMMNYCRNSLNAIIALKIWKILLFQMIILFYR